MAGPGGIPSRWTAIITLFMGLRERGGCGSDMAGLLRYLGLVREQVAVFGHPLCERERRPAEDLLDVVGDEGWFVERLGEHRRVGVTEFGGETQTDEPLPHHVHGYF